MAVVTWIYWRLRYQGHEHVGLGVGGTNILDSVCRTRAYWARCEGHEHIGLGVGGTSILGSVLSSVWRTRVYWARCGGHEHIRSVSRARTCWGSV